MERARLAGARHRKHWTLEEASKRIEVDKATLMRWEKGKSLPQPMNLRKLCDVYELTARELGLEMYVTEQPTIAFMEPQDDLYSAFLTQDLTLRLMKTMWGWPCQNMRYHELQQRIILEVEDNHSMDHDDLMSRRDALRRIAALPIEVCGLTSLAAVLKRPVEEILAQCATGVTACWYLRKGKDLTFAFDITSKYVPTLKEIAKSASTSQRKAAADLLTQCLLLQSVLAWNVKTTDDAIGYAQQAEFYSKIAEDTMLQILALRTQAAAQSNANKWEHALQAGLKAKYLLETTQKTSHIPQQVRSYVYAGVATFQAYNGAKEDALLSLEKAHIAFFAQSPNETIPIWVDHSIGNLLDNDGLTHFHLGRYKQAVDSFAQIHDRHADDATIPLSCRVSSLIEQMTAEVSRDDQPRDMERCIDLWVKGIEGAKTLQSTLRFNEALQAYTAMRAAWPGEQRVKALRERIIHW